MHAALIEVDVAGVDREAGLKGLREHVIPTIKGMDGFHSGVWLPGNDEDQALSLTVWDTEAAAHEMANRFGPGSSPQAGASIVRCEVREVAATA